MKNTKWKAILWETGRTNRWVSKKTGIPESYLSMAINGRFILSSEQQKIIAEALNRKISDVFQES